MRAFGVGIARRAEQSQRRKRLEESGTGQRYLVHDSVLTHD
jgi:hypothetical protein